MKNTLILSSIILVLISCNKEKPETCTRSEPAYVTHVEAPSRGKVNEPVAIQVEFQVTNGCGQFGKFLESSNEKVRTIEVQAKHVGCLCTDDLPLRTTLYEFVADEPGIYTLRFKSWRTEFIEVNLEMQ